MSETETNRLHQETEPKDLTIGNVVDIGGLAVFGAAAYMLDAEENHTNSLATDTDDQLRPAAK